MMRANASVDLHTGTATVNTSPTVILPYVDLIQLSFSWCIWVANDGPNTANVEFTGAPDGTNPDIGTLQAFSVPMGQSAMLGRDTELRRWWSIMAWADTGTCNLRYGVTALRERA